MRVVFQTLPLLLLSFALTACGAGGKGGSSEPSSFDKLSGITAELQAQLQETARPISDTDAILTTFAQLPKDLALSTEDYKQFVISAINGEMIVPGGVDEKAKAGLVDFAGKFKTYVLTIKATPDNAQALVIKITEALTTVPVLVGKVEGEAQLTINNPLASKSAKDKAQKESTEVKALGDKVTGEVQAILEQAKALPAQTAEALGKFVEALKGAGINSVDELMAAPGQVAQETVEGAKDGAEKVVETTKDSAAGAAN